MSTRKVMIIRREAMVNRQNWSPALRDKIHPYVFKNLGSFQMPYSVCKNKYEFAQWLYETVGLGYYYIFIWRPGYYKKKNRLRPYRIATVELKLHKELSFTPMFHDLRRIQRFKWWEEK